MKKTLLIILGVTACFACGSFTQKMIDNTNDTENQKDEMQQQPLKLGVFSLSLSVADLAVSRQFYENLGFRQMGGGEEMNYLIMKNEHAIIGLFQGMFEGNILTFNPGWDENAQNVAEFDDVRKIQQTLKSLGVSLESEADESTTGPGSMMVKDPDGNLILVDQHR